MKNEILGLSEDYANRQSTAPRVFSNRISFFARLFGCWHFRIGRPMTVKKETYCTCVTCGAKIKFDTETLKTVGSYYYSPHP